MSDEIKNVVIVGGGTAGWLSANILAAKLSNKINITLVESPDVATIGVGEGTVPTMRETLKLIGISETDFIKKCNATFKQAIKFVDWMKPQSEQGHEQEQQHYYHLFQYPLTQKFDPTTSWLNDQHAPSFADVVSLQGIACDLGLAPKKITTKEYAGIFDYAYHLDAGKFAALLAQHGIEQFGITHIQQTITDVKTDDQEFIEQLVLNNGSSLTADLFIDCSGFQGLLIDKTLNVGFENKNDVLFVDKALAVQVPYEHNDQPIASHTIATAQQFGWTWDIGLTDRRGVGFVYSSKYCSDEQAKQTLSDYIGGVVDDSTFRKLDMKIGYREKFWHKNCVAIGLSAGFLEPLEATAILLIEATAKLVADHFPSDKQTMAVTEKNVNEIARHGWDKVIEFIKLHYCISDRDDSDFWRDNRNESSIPSGLLEKLKTWRTRVPNDSDFTSQYDVFHLENYQYVLYGMNFPTNVKNSPICPNSESLYSEQKQQLFSQHESVRQHLSSHRELIEKIAAFGLQKI